MLIYWVLLTLCRGLASLLFNRFSLLFQKVISSVYSKVTSRYVYRDKIIYQQIKEGYLTIWHRSFTFNSNKSPTRCNNFPVYFLTFIYSSACFERFPAHHQKLNDCSGSLWFYLRIVVTVALCSWSGRQKINWKIVASGWWFIWIVRWCTDLQTLNLTGSVFF